MNKNKDISSILREEGKDKKASKVIAIRADSETNEMIRVLEEMEKKSKTEIIIHAIKSSYNGILIESIVENEIKSLIKKVFAGAKLRGCFPMDLLVRGMIEEKISITYDETDILFKLPEFSKNVNGEQIFSDMDMLEMHISVKDMHCLELKFKKPLINENIQNISSVVLKKIYEVGAKWGLIIESEELRKKNVRINFVLKGNVRTNKIKWKLVEKDLRKMKRALNDLLAFETEYSKSKRK